GEHPLVILRNMVDGKVVTETITILEGWTFAQMRQQLARARDLKQTIAGYTDEEIMRELGVPDLAAEGRFAPDTYVYAPGVTTDMQIIRLAYENQRRNLYEAWDARQPDLPISTPDEALVLASIIEKETGLASERARIAGVFVNRLRIGMRLQSDPTVIYGMRERYDGNIRRSDLTRDTPWNTYTRAGLPPTPIALPGRDAIFAALNPEHTDALFFVAVGDGSGGHYFSATLAEHNRAVARYLDRLRMRSLTEAWQEISREEAAAAAAAAEAASMPAAPPP
ncbi:MAG: endolytic transglycosylase MltG, partial [Pseudomonadota bacterium]